MCSEDAERRQDPITVILLSNIRGRFLGCLLYRMQDGSQREIDCKQKFSIGESLRQNLDRYCTFTV